jgi:hypothetical protein
MIAAPIFAGQRFRRRVTERWFGGVGDAGRGDRDLVAGGDGATAMARRSVRPPDGISKGKTQLGKLI